MSIEETNIKRADISKTMRESYLEYAMSVIIGRALPDVRDGLKPVHRRILFAMSNLNLANNRPYAKSARVIGDVVGKYHPHGDSSIYDALVRLAQDFSMRYQLVEGQGNFGSVDGDAAAAMRYTEVRLQKISAYLLDDIDKNTVDFHPNYDNSLTEPVVLPTKVPSLLMNGSSGIAVGMATNIPPHNLGELVDGIIYLIDSGDDYSFEELLLRIKGPDFPTAGLILGSSGIIKAYQTGRGVIKIRGRAHEETIDKRLAIVITELPYAVNKASLVEKVAELANSKKLPIHDIRDESDRDGMRVVIELKRGELTESVLNNLYSQTQLQKSFGINMLAVINKQPKVLTLVAVLRHFIDHRIDVITRRTRFSLRKALERIHIVEGLFRALTDIDAIIEIIKKAPNALQAREKLTSNFDFSDVQTKAILDMRLQRLTGLEREKLSNEKDELTKTIAKFRKILSGTQEVLNIIKTELGEIKKDFADQRRTQIIEDPGDINQADLIAREFNVVTLTRQGYIKRCLMSDYRKQNRGGKGKIGMVTKDTDLLVEMLVGSTHDTILLFSNLGRVFWKYIYELPEFSRTAKGRALVNILPLEENESIVSLAKVGEDLPIDEARAVLMITKNGVIKKSSLNDYRNRRTGGVRAIVLDPNDNLVKVCLTEPEPNEQIVFIATSFGMSTLFKIGSLRTQGRVTRGARGIRLKTIKSLADHVVSMELVNKDEHALTVSKNGYGKRTKIKLYPVGRRGNIGILNMKVTARTGNVICSLSTQESDELLLLSSSGNIIRLGASQISVIGRITQGVKLINLHASDSLVAVCRFSKVDFEAFSAGEGDSDNESDSESDDTTK
ncbi:MAG: DNA gyrase subunit A [SAR324 cluster bacterium]|nr:DNA gyrase subunit A [SAR324 cluster bacterium]